jgi:cytosine/adenosine deaminase-related metal-dependent hydrolase
LSDSSLAALGDLVRFHKSGLHIHVAEAHDDVARTARDHGCSILDRLATYRLLNDRAILAHGVHLTPKDLERVRRAGAWLVHNPRSNMNNGVGHARVEEFGARAALGSDGWPADMWEEARLTHVRVRERLGLASAYPVLQLLEGSQQLASTVFNRPFGALEKGAVADVVVCGYVPPTPIDTRNAGWHALFGIRTSMIERVMVGGQWVMVDGLVAGLDLPEVFRHARCEAAGIWTRMRGQEPVGRQTLR